MSEPLAAPERLQRRLEDLESARRAGALPPEGVSALAECAFRIAVHRSTPPSKAMELLQRALRLDRANPKYHYHVALLCFRFGQLDAAAQWLERARQLCPTSHRVWAHIALLQRELNDRYRDAKYVPDEHLRRWREIAGQIRVGNDAIDVSLASFKPKEVVHPNAPPRPEVVDDERPHDEPPPRRLVAPGSCRWPPVHDLLADDLLESEAGERKRNMLREHLERAAAAIGAGAAAAFVVLATEWLLRGYSPEFIRRIRPSTTPSSPSSQLLDTMLELLEGAPSAVPERLAAAVAENRIPLLLAAVIHRLHVIGTPLSLNKLAADLGRVAAWSGSEEGEAQALVRALEQGGRALEPRPRTVIPDFPPAERHVEEQASTDLIAASEAELAAMQAEIQSAREWLAAHKDADVTDDLVAEATRIRTFVLGVKDRTANSVASLAAVRSAGKADTPDAAQRLAKLEPSWQNLTTQCGPLMKLLKRYPEPAAPAAERAAEPRQAEENTPPLPAGPLERLAALAQELETRFPAPFDEAAASFAAYSPRQQSAPPMKAVRFSVRARKAEALYRLGKREEARRQWNAILVEDRLSLDILRNLAVCDSRSGDMHRSLQSWRNYTEMLYFHAVAAGDPSRLANERAELHRNFGNAYAPRPFFDRRRDGAEPETDGDEIQAFLASGSRVRLYMRHRLLALLAERFTFHTPFVLGVTRVAGESAREAARAKIETWTNRLALLLPRRVGPKFAAAVSASLQRALEDMKSSRAMTELGQHSAYDDERKRYIGWLRDVVLWKLDLFELLRQFPDPSRKPELLDPLVELCAVDEIPLDTSDELYNAHVLRQHPGALDDIVSKSTVHHVIALLRNVFPSHRDDDPARKTGTQLYARLTGELADRAILRDDDLRSIINHPGGVESLDFYPPHLSRDLQARNGSAESLEFLRRAWQQYPRSGGIAHDFALMLAYSGQLDEAKRVLASGIEHAFHESTREPCRNLLNVIDEHH